MILPAFTAGKRYAVLGLGKSGMATALALHQAGAQVTAWDDKEEGRKAAAAQGVPVADLRGIDWRGVTALAMSPGIPHSFPQPHPAAAAALAAGVPLTSDIALLLQAEPQARFIGITGTNGKSTTTALIGHILQEAGERIAVGGNLGTPVLRFPALGKGGIYVLELSSYQLELVERNAFDVAVLLNITPDHLDRHGGMAGYVAAKRRIVRRDGPQQLICGVDDAYCRGIAAEAAQQGNVTVTTISQAAQPDAMVRAQDGALMADGRLVMALDGLTRLMGAHNRQNIAAAYAACRALGVAEARIIAGIRSFPGLAHRQHYVGQRAGVRFVNDSKATNADAAAKALACYAPVYWILGGRAKEGGLKGLEAFMPRVRHAYLIGDAAEAFGRWLEGRAAYSQCGTLAAAVEQAAALAFEEKLEGATVLLSPACASFDQFRNFEERGEAFITLARKQGAA